MKTIETQVEITKDRALRLESSSLQELKPGMYHVVLVIDDQPTLSAVSPQKPATLHEFELLGWPSTSTFRREDFYDDNGR